MTHRTDLIPAAAARTLPQLFHERVRRSPERCAYRRFDCNDRCCEDISWQETENLAALWQEALRRDGLRAGDRVAVMLRNCVEWVYFDLAALGLGLITVPLYHYDRPDNIAYILQQTEARVLVFEGESQWEQLHDVLRPLRALVRIVALHAFAPSRRDGRLIDLPHWLPDADAAGYVTGGDDPEAPASIVFTSGTTGHPKGVVLSHANILANVHACLQRVPVYTDDQFLSFLPLSHMLERTAGYYLPMAAGAGVTHVRSLEKLREDFHIVRPTNIICVPRIFERVYKRVQARLEEGPAFKRRLFELTLAIGRRRFLHAQRRGSWSLSFLLWPLLRRLVAAPVLAALGGRIRLAVSGGAPLDPELSCFFNALGLTIVQGYGLTETSPVVSTNTPEDNRPETVGKPLPGVEVKLGENRELLIRGPSVMRGYWRDSAATRAAIDEEGWFHTGDQAVLDAEGRITLCGRLKEIIVLANGEKISPADVESAISKDPLFEQVMVVGENKPYLAALVVLNDAEWNRLAPRLGMDTKDAAQRAERAEQILLQRIASRMSAFPGFARVRRVRATAGPWEVKSGALTATMKLRRNILASRFSDEIEQLYAGH